MEEKEVEEKEVDLTNFKFNYQGKVYTYEKILKELAGGSEDIAINLIESLTSANLMTIVEENILNKKLVNDLKDVSTLVEAEKIKGTEQKALELARAEKISEKLTYEKIGFDFPSAEKAMEFKKYVLTLNITTSIEFNDDGSFTVVVNNVSDGELNKLNLKYKSDKVVSATVGIVDKTAKTAVNLVDYTAKKVAAPVLGATGKSAISIAKTLISTTAKVGGTLISSTVDGSKEIKESLASDNDIKKAKASLIEAKIGIKNSFKSLLNNFGSSGSGRIM